MADMSLDDIMSDKPYEAEEVAEEPTEEPDQIEAEAEDAPEEPEQPEGEEPAPVAEPEPKMVPLAALQDERQKNRTVTERLAQIEQMLQASRKPEQQQDRPKPPDMFEQPEQYTQHLMTMMQEREANLIAEMSERFTRSQHGDEAVDAALEAAKAAGTVDQFRGQRDPWGELVKWHKQHQVMSEIGADPDAWRAQERERMRQELMAEMVGQQQKQAAGKAGPSLAGQTNLGSRTRPAWSGPTPLSEILKG